MRTICYCTYCPKHPLFEQRKSLPVITGWSVGHYIESNVKVGRLVDCLSPASSAFDELDIIPEDNVFPITAYNDGGSETGFEGRSYLIRAYCEDEEYAE